MMLPQKLKRIITPLFPQAVVYNKTSYLLYIVVDGTREDHQSSSHSIVGLPPHSNTKVQGIDDPEAIISSVFLRRDAQGNIWAPRFTPVLKTPAGSIVHIHESHQAIPHYSHESAGILGTLARAMRIRPSIKDTNSFSNGRFVSPIVASPLFNAYTTLAQTLKQEEPS